MRLGVNIDHVATLRQARCGAFPDPLDAALVCERAGATSIVCHLREDRRHIRDNDVRRIKKSARIPLNLEMSIARGIVEVALRIKPSQVTLVPERRSELTTEGGLDVERHSSRLGPVVEGFLAHGINVSLFVDPVKRQLVAARRIKAPIIELHTGKYANAKSHHSMARELDAIKRAAHLAREMGLEVAAGHGLDYRNVLPIAQIDEIEELNIGFSIIARSVSIGLELAVREMIAVITESDSGLVTAKPQKAAKTQRNLE